MMKEWITRFMTECPSAKAQSFANSPFGTFVRNGIPDAIYATGLVNKETYLVTGSVGAGNWAMVPWVCIFDRSITTSATKGIYIVYLLSKDSKRLYLTLNQGCTEISNTHGKRETINIMREKAKEIHSMIDSHGFFSTDSINLGESLSSLGQYYERGTIYYKQYDVDNIPDEEVLNQDLSNMMDIYQQYAQTLDEGEWWPSLAEYDPGISKGKWLELLNDPDCLGPDCGNALAMFFDYGGTATCTQLALEYGTTPMSISGRCTGFAKAVHKKTGCPLALRESGENRYWTIPFIGKNAEKGEAGSFKWKLRPELFEALTEFNILRYLNIKKLGRFDSWTIVDYGTAIKKCDKSFFEYNGSGVPKAICWFFNADHLELGQVIPWEVKYQGKIYEMKIRNESSDRRRVRIFWNADLGKQLEEYRNTQATATFRRDGDHIFQLTMKGDETEMKISEKVNQIKNYIGGKGFSYSDGLIENFYLSLKSKPFVILAGTSGTGKTRLVRLFAEAIGANQSNGQYKEVAVRPDWSDSTDLFGHVNLNGTFVPGAILDFLAEAQRNPDHPYILCLDEMNLARVEYYLSDFLSVIESRDMDGEHIKSYPLVKLEQYGTDTKAKEKYGEIRFPENLYVVGTVNMDETTFPFSRKVLDRANTIEFNYVDLVPDFTGSVEATQLSEKNTFLKTEILRLVECPEEDMEFVEDICKRLEEINRILQKANAHVGYRVRDEICFYMLNNRKANLLAEDDALDNEIMQKILPRIQGSGVSVKDMLCELFAKVLAKDYDRQEGDAAGMRKLLDSTTDIIYPNSAKKVMFMVRRFEEDGFTSYWL